MKILQTIITLSLVWLTVAAGSAPAFDAVSNTQAWSSQEWRSFGKSSPTRPIPEAFQSLKDVEKGNSAGDKGIDMNAGNATETAQDDDDTPVIRKKAPSRPTGLRIKIN